MTQKQQETAIQSESSEINKNLNLQLKHSLEMNEILDRNLKKLRAEIDQRAILKINFEKEKQKIREELEMKKDCEVKAFFEEVEAFKRSSKEQF